MCMNNIQSNDLNLQSFQISKNCKKNSQKRESKFIIFCLVLNNVSQSCKKTWSKENVVLQFYIYSICYIYFSLPKLVMTYWKNSIKSLFQVKWKSKLNEPSKLLKPVGIRSSLRIWDDFILNYRQDIPFKHISKIN